MRLLSKLYNKLRRRIVVYTALFGDYDEFIEPPSGIRDCDFVMYTDNFNIKSHVYKIIYTKSQFSDTNRSAKIYKILPHRYFPEYEYSLWIDANVLLKTKNIKQLFDHYLSNNDIAFVKHPERDCIYDELQACLEQNRDDPNVMKKQIERYRKDGYPKHYGLISGTVILRRHNKPEIIKVDEEWWSEIQQFSKRDQLSFNYIAWKNKLNYTLMDVLLWDNEYFKLIDHKNKK